MSQDPPRLQIYICAPFLEDHHREILEGLSAYCGFDLFYDTPARDLDLSDADIVFGNPDPARFSTCKHLKWFAASFAGVDALLAANTIPEDTIFTSGSGNYGPTISEAVIWMILTLFRQGKGYIKGQEEHAWQHLGEMRTICGSTVCIIGTGDIGRHTAMRLKAFEPDSIRGVRRTPAEPDDLFDEMFTVSNLTEAVRDADLVISCVPSTPETVGFLNADVFSAMGENAVLINVGRGTAVDQDALLKALRDGTIAGAALDVTCPEPLPTDHPLWNEPNCLILPHVAGNMAAPITRDLCVENFCRNLRVFIQNPVHPEALMDNVVDRKKGY